LKEIQEAEARKAAEREAIAAAARREAAERELIAQAHSPAAQPGLPSSSTWASSASPITPGSATQSAWTKPAVGKATGQQTGKQKTLQQIQKEEEARKQRLAAQAAANVASSNYGTPAPTLSSGKSYANLAGKSTPIQPMVGTGAWTTVGASGKVKTPSGTAPPPAAVRSASNSGLPAVAKKPSVMRSTTMGGQVAKANAEEEFRKWAVGELRPDLQKGINGKSDSNIYCTVTC
jgi:PERQ amino acid-rich with GYF domain-containing protein